MSENGKAEFTVGTVEDQIATADLVATANAFDVIWRGAEAQRAVDELWRPADTIGDLFHLFTPRAVWEAVVLIPYRGFKADSLQHKAAEAREFLGRTDLKTEGQNGR